MRARRIGFLALVLALIGTLALSGAAGAGTSAEGGVAWTNPDYDYAPSVMYDNGVYYWWWCSPTSGHDSIKYRSFTVSTGVYSAIQVVLQVSSGAWDSAHTCDPNVVKGSFTYKNVSYAYAMYYTGTADILGNAGAVGLAFSNDRVTWTKWKNGSNQAAPVVSAQFPNSSRYGAGQPSVLKVGTTWYMFHTDQNSAGTMGIYRRSSTDGKAWGAPTLVPLTGTQSINANVDVGYDVPSATYYLAAPLPGRSGDRDTNAYGLYTIPAANLLTGTWTTQAILGTGVNGYYINSSPGLVRDTIGGLPTLPTVTVYTGSAGFFSDPTTGNDTLNWDLSWMAYTSSTTTTPLQRYLSASGSDLTSTTGAVPSGYALQGPQGYLLDGPATGTQPVYECRLETGDLFDILDPACGDITKPQRLVGVIGYVWLTAPGGIPSIALYSCRRTTPADNFISTDPACEGFTLNSLLGYAKSTA